SMSISRLGIALLLLAAVSACANPVVAPPLTAPEREKDCTAIEADITETSNLKRAARDDDKFMWRYVFVVNGFVSAYRMNKAEAAAQERLDELRALGQAKGC